MDINNKFSNVIIYTSTLYEEDEISGIRSELCLNMLKNASNLGINVVVKDGGSNNKFINRIKEMSNVVLVQDRPGERRKSMGGDRRDALCIALEIADKKNMRDPCFFWTEPEKDNLITEENLSVITTEIKRGTNIVVPARKEDAWGTLPANQKWLERRANKRSLKIIEETCASQNQELLDLWFGPKMFDRESARYFVDYNKEKNRTDLWDGIIIPVIEAIREGKKVSSIQVNYEYSRGQRNNESEELKNVFTTKRLEQYAQILKEMGDKNWTGFFKEAEEELNKINELNKTGELKSENQELLGEMKKSALKKFFR